MGDRATQKMRMQHAGQMNVIDEACLSTQQRRILDARNTAPDMLMTILTHSHVAFPECQAPYLISPQ
jgi:hypothetical protein